MYYAPHLLQKRLSTTPALDEYGREIVGDSAEEWLDVCRCRCDNNSDREVMTPDGKVVRPDFRVVFDANNVNVAPGDYVRCLNRNGSVKGDGRVLRMKTLNYLSYGEMYF